ncbi:hypothetical protein [uncultured Bifidobacterium sp.]|uniref:hypothetical protein n=1 Tax=uncultured Bifidobacterium sp. TaxID=165187 RepID=UPI00338F0BE1
MRPGRRQQTYSVNHENRHPRPPLPRENPQRPGFRFDGWFINEVVYDFSRPVTDNLILTARWTHLTCRTTSEASAPTRAASSATKPPPSARLPVEATSNSAKLAGQ